jgi:carbonic anhydrase
MIEARQIAIVGSIYDLATGKVNFLEDTYVG